MSIRTMARSSSNRNSASARASSVFPTPGRPREPRGADRPAGVGEPRPGTADGVRHGLDRLVLVDDPLVQLVLHPDEFLHLALHEAGRGAGGPRGGAPPH